MKERQYFMNGIFRETTEGPKPYFSTCKQCGATFFPAETVCNQCMSEEMELADLPQYARLYSYTVMYRPVNQYETPHALAKVDYPECRLRLTAPLIVPKGVALEKGNEFVLDSKIEMEVGTLWEEADREIIGFKYKVVDM